MSATMNAPTWIDASSLPPPLLSPIVSAATPMLGWAVGNCEGLELGLWVGELVGAEEVGAIVGDAVWWLHAPGTVSYSMSLSCCVVEKPVRHCPPSSSQPQRNATPLAATSPLQSMLQ